MVKKHDNDTPNRRAGGCKKISCLLSAAERETMFVRLHESIPDPRPALHFATPFQLLCAVMLSAQTTDQAVNRVSGPLFARAPDAAALAALSEAEIGQMIRTLGLWRVKAANLRTLAGIIAGRYHGEVPDSLEDLLALPGVGVKTAYVVLNVAFGRPLVAVDTHIFRLCTRTGLCREKSPLRTQAVLGDLVPEAYRLQAHHLLILHGRHVCRARRPDCEHCCLSSLCRSRAGQ